MHISLIVAMSSNHVIGINNRLPWHLPADLKHFKELTWGKPIIMGRKTYESIGKPLPGRRNIIVSHNTQLKIADCEVVSSLEAAFALVATAPEAMVIGGAQLFKAAAEYADRLYLTIIHATFEGDSFLPEEIAVDNPLRWQLVEDVKHSADAKNPYAYNFLTFQGRP
ncbi:MAG TPA: dihydrofolate reductase [Gammaproteobacteria bacterium]|nr:dihydrofolate reductase [Gammaproteobacteria bacterium]